MKKIIYLMLTISIGACSKNEITPINSESGTPPITRANIPKNITTENGYLVVKDFQNLDSLTSEIAKMTSLERMAWENSINFESAYTHFKPYFDIFDTISSEHSLQDFKQRYRDILNITPNGEDYEVNYPFNVENLELVLSKDGRIKVGSTLWIYTADRKINIHDATDERIQKYKDAQMSISSEEVAVYYFTPSKLKYGRESNAEQLIHLPNLPRKNEREYYASLDILKREYKNGIQITHRRYLALFQQGKKKKFLAGYNIYNTTYYVVIFKIKRTGHWEYANPIDIWSREHKGGIYYMLGYVDGQTFPPFYISIKHGSRGYSGPQIDYSYSGSGNAVPVFDNNSGYYY